VLEREATHVPHFEDLTTFPAVHRDLAITLPEDTPAAMVVAAIEEAAGPHLRSAEIFDVYHGPQAGAGRKSLAVHLQFGAPDRTLTDEDAHEIVDRVLRHLAERHGAVHRA
jgi:phenylalanyl-tRNA synthetase beta chain